MTEESSDHHSIQNLKGVRFKLSDSDVDNVKIKLKGKKVFTGQDIQNATDQFEVLNTDHYITEINSDMAGTARRKADLKSDNFGVLVTLLAQHAG